MKRLTTADFNQDLLDLCDEYVHGKVTRRDFMDRASKFAVGGLSAAALLEALGPNYAFAQQFPKDDARIRTETAEYPSPKGAGTMRGTGFCYGGGMANTLAVRIPDVIKAAGKNYEAFIYPGTSHGFHNDTTPRYDEAAAKLAEQRTLDFFRKYRRA